MFIYAGNLVKIEFNARMSQQDIVLYAIHTFNKTVNIVANVNFNNKNKGNRCV